MITRGEVKPDPKKEEAICEFRLSKSPKHIKQFLDLAGYYRRLILTFSSIAKPLSYLLKKGVEFLWTQNQQKAFNEVKDILCSYPLLHDPDFNDSFIVICDASGYGIASVLSQKFNEKILLVAYASRTLSDTEINNATIGKELLAILYCVKTFRPYLYGREFQLETDHRSLVCLYNMKNPNSKLLQWRLYLNQYDDNIIYKKGVINFNADALSRNPLREVILNHSDPGIECV